ncbi:MFS transporter [Sphingomonas koreensis]
MDRTQIRQLVPVIAGTLTAMLPTYTVPFLISGAVEVGHFGLEAASWIGTASIGAVAIASMAVAPLLNRIPLRQSIVGLGLAATLSYLLMAAVSSFAGFLLLAIAGGAACGGLLGCMAMVVARTADPDRSYGVIYASTGVVFAVLMFLLPTVGAAFSPAMMFVLIAAVALCTLPIAVRVSADANAHAGPEAGSVAPVNWAWVLLLVLVMTISQPLYGGVYGFSERKAVEVGLGSVEVGVVLSVSTLLCIIGSLCVAAIGTRYGRLIPTVVVMALATVAYGLTLRATDPTAFIIGFLIFGFMQLAMNSYFFGLASALDRDGKVAALLQGYSLIPYALGTGIFGSLTKGGALTSLALPAVAINLIATILLLPILIALDRQNRRTQAAGTLNLQPE